MNKFYYFAILMAAYVLPSISEAHSWVSKTQISRIAINDWGAAIFIYTTTVASNEGCPGEGNVFVLLRSNPQFKENYAAALSAFHNKTTIGGYVYGCNSDHYNLPNLQRIDLLLDANVQYP